MSREEIYADALRQKGWSVQPPPEPSNAPKPPTCAVCGAVDEAAAYGNGYYDLSDLADDTEIAEWLTPIRVDVGVKGQEGWDFKRVLLCEQHDAAVIDKLIELGFGTHHHGSTHPLADPRCPGEIDLQQCPVGRGEILNPYWEDE